MSRKETSAAYYAANRERIKARSREYAKANPEKRKRCGLAYSQRLEEKEKRRAYRAEYNQRPETKERTNRKERERQATDTNYAALCRVRRRLFAALKGLDVGGRSLALIGCGSAELRAHIESLFTSGMTWANRSEWHVDHIWPLKHFDLTDPVQLAKASHYTNLRPLWAKDNRRRSYNMSPAEQTAFDAWKAALC